MATAQIVKFFDKLFAAGLALIAAIYLIAALISLLGGVVLLPTIIGGIFGFFLSFVLLLVGAFFAKAAMLMWDLEGKRSGLFFIIYTVLSIFSLLTIIIGLLLSLVAKNVMAIGTELVAAITMGYVVLRLLNVIKARG